MKKQRLQSTSSNSDCDDSMSAIPDISSVTSVSLLESPRRSSPHSNMQQPRLQSMRSNSNCDDSMLGIPDLSSATSERLLESSVPMEPQPGSSHERDIVEPLQVRHGNRVRHGRQMAHSQRSQRPLSTKRSASWTNNQLQKSVLERVDTLMQYFQDNDAKGEDDYFCMSLALSLKRIRNERKKAHMKAQIMQLLEELLSDED